MPENVSVLPGNVPALLAMARAERQKGNDRAACVHLRAAAEICPHSLPAQTALAQCLRDLELPDEAAAVHRRALLGNGSHVPSLLGLGWIARQQGDDGLALEYFTGAYESASAAHRVNPDEIGRAHV